MSEREREQHWGGNAMNDKGKQAIKNAMQSHLNVTQSQSYLRCVRLAWPFNFDTNKQKHYDCSLPFFFFFARIAVVNWRHPLHHADSIIGEHNFSFNFLAKLIDWSMAPFGHLKFNDNSQTFTFATTWAEVLTHPLMINAQRAYQYHACLSFVLLIGCGYI